MKTIVQYTRSKASPGNSWRPTVASSTSVVLGRSLSRAAACPSIPPEMSAPNQCRHSWLRGLPTRPMPQPISRTMSFGPMPTAGRSMSMNPRPGGPGGRAGAVGRPDAAGGAEHVDEPARGEVEGRLVGVARYGEPCQVQVRRLPVPDLLVRGAVPERGGCGLPARLGVGAHARLGSHQIEVLMIQSHPAPSTCASRLSECRPGGVSNVISKPGSGFAAWGPNLAITSGSSSPWRPLKMRPPRLTRTAVTARPSWGHAQPRSVNRESRYIRKGEVCR